MAAIKFETEDSFEDYEDDWRGTDKTAVMTSDDEDDWEDDEEEE